MEGYQKIKPGTLLCPTPAVMVSCAEKDDPSRCNLLTVAWVGTVNSEPPMVSVSIRPERYSWHMIAESGEFVVNMPDERLAKATDFCGVRSGRDIDKADACGLKLMPADEMKVAPAVVGCPICLSCKVRQRISLGSHDMFIGEVVAVNVRQDLVDEKGGIHLEKAGLICSSHGLYQKLGDVLGFFGWSVARPEVYKKRMKTYRVHTNRE